jgi:hypothetical protein
MIELNEPPFALGGNRACHIHPENVHRCIKTILPERTPEIKHRDAAWWKQWRPVTSFNDNIEEELELRAIERRAPQLIAKHIPRCYGFVDTNLGQGLVTDLYRDHDGAISLNLRDYLRKNGKTDAVLSAVGVFQASIIEHQILSRALLLHNIIAQKKSAGDIQLYLIDGLGNPEFLPLADIIPVLRTKKIHRKMVKMNHHIEVIASGGEL